MMNRREALKVAAAALGGGLLPLSAAAKEIVQIDAPLVPLAPGEFFTREQIVAMLRSAHKVEWDFATASGDTIKEKYEDLYMTVYRLCNQRLGRKINGQEWMVTSPEVAAIFETARHGFHPAPFDRNNADTWGVNIDYVGCVNNRWRLYKDALFPIGLLLVGTDTKGHINFGKVRIRNFFDEPATQEDFYLKEI